MASAPSTPSYARSTRASLSRGTPNTPESPDSITPRSPTSSPRKLKRPSPLTGHDRQIALLMSQLRARAHMLTIKAANAEKPCPLAALPTEIRDIIYKYVFPDVDILIQKPGGKRGSRALWPALLRVSNRIRCEVAYAFYTSANFEAEVYKVDFSHLKGWVESLPVDHRLYLTRNRNVSVKLFDHNGLFTVNRELWEECRRFGNLYTVKHKAHLVSFSRLAQWFLWCSKPIHTSFQFKYMIPFEHGRILRSRGDPWSTGCPWAVAAEEVLKHDVGSFMMPCIQDAKLTKAQKGAMKKEALRMVEGLDKGFREIEVWTSEKIAWDDRVQSVRRHFETW